MNLAELFDMNEGPHDPHIFKAIFMAGAPGSGKSTVAKKLFDGSGLKSLNVDSFWQLYKSKGKSTDYDRFWELYKHQEANYVDGRLGLLIDGTAKNPEIISSIKSRLEALGYDTMMVFVNTDLQTSIARTINRANTPGKDSGRHIDTDFVSDAWKRVQQGLGKLQSTFGRSFYIIDNSEHNPDLAYVSKSVNSWLREPPTRPAARDWLSSQKPASTDKARDAV